MKRCEPICWLLFLGVGTGLFYQFWPPTDLIMFTAPGMVSKTVDSADGHSRRYVLYVPREYDGVRPLPLVIFLHGVGDIGFDGRRQLKSGLGPEVWSRHRAARPFPYFVLFPQARHPWSGDSQDGQSVMTVLDKTLDEYTIDSDRIYLTGISSGAEGVWDLAAAHPERWAALVPISCGSSRVNVDKSKSLPIRWYQNTYDGIEGVRSAVAELQGLGSLAELIENDDLSHDAWTRAYADPGLYEWLDRQVRNPRGEH